MSAVGDSAIGQLSADTRPVDVDYDPTPAVRSNLSIATAQHLLEPMQVLKEQNLYREMRCGNAIVRVIE